MHKAYGGPEVLMLVDVPRPAAGSEGSRKNNLAVSAALNQAGDLTNAQFPISNSPPKGLLDPKLTTSFG